MGEHCGKGTVRLMNLDLLSESKAVTVPNEQPMYRDTGGSVKGLTKQLFGSLQDWLVKEMRIQQIAT